MDITSTSASAIQVNKPTTDSTKPTPAATPIPEDMNLKQIQAEIKQITDEMKQTLDSKLQPLPKDTVQFSKTEAPAEVSAVPTAETVEKPKV